VTSWVSPIEVAKRKTSLSPILRSSSPQSNEDKDNDVTAPCGPRPPHYRGYTIILRHTTLGRTPLDE
jgi:hypothetical protein